MFLDGLRRRVQLANKIATIHNQDSRGRTAQVKSKKHVHVVGASQRTWKQTNAEQLGTTVEKLSWNDNVMLLGIILSDEEENEDQTNAVFAYLS